MLKIRFAGIRFGLNFAIIAKSTSVTFRLPKIFIKRRGGGGGGGGGGGWWLFKFTSFPPLAEPDSPVAEPCPACTPAHLCRVRATTRTLCHYHSYSSCLPEPPPAVIAAPAHTSTAGASHHCRPSHGLPSLTESLPLHCSCPEPPAARALVPCGSVAATPGSSVSRLHTAV